MPNVPDQTDLVSANEKLTADLTQANADLTAVRASLASVTTERDTAAANLAEVTKERDALKSSQADFDKSVAAKVAEMGISANAVPKGTEAKKLTHIELIKAVRAGTMTDEQAAAAMKS